jgi:hypothetical protein
MARFLFVGGRDDFSLLAAMLRAGLIPPAEHEEAFLHLLRKGVAFVPNNLDHRTLKERGFYTCLEKFLTENHLFSNFDWANTTKALVIQ